MQIYEITFGLPAQAKFHWMKLKQQVLKKSPDSVVTITKTDAMINKLLNYGNQWQCGGPNLVYQAFGFHQFKVACLDSRCICNLIIFILKRLPCWLITKKQDSYKIQLISLFLLHCSSWTGTETDVMCNISPLEAMFDHVSISSSIYLPTKLNNTWMDTE